MTATVYLNGRYLPADQATIRPDDRGFLFADGVYEVLRCYNGRALAMKEHLERLAYSLGELKIRMPEDVEPWPEITRKLLEANGLADASVYWQITRGAAPRDHRFPEPAVRPTVYAAVTAAGPLKPTGYPQAMKAITHDEIRWTRCAIKSVALLPNVLARQAAYERGCDEAIFVRHEDEVVTEGTARSIFIMRDGELHTHPLDGRILGSITRKLMLGFARELKIKVHEEEFTKAGMMSAEEVIAVGTTTEVRSVSEVDGRKIGGGEVGPMSRRLYDAYRRFAAKECGVSLPTAREFE